MAQVQRYDWADFMRGIMMFMVVLYHSEVYYGSGHTWSWIFEPVFLSGFFYVSGYLFTRDISKIDVNIKIKQVVRAIILPYFFFVTILALPKLIVGHAQLHQLLIDIIVLRASWFVITIAVLQIVYAVILKFKPTISFLIYSTLIMFVLGYAFVVMYRDCPSWILENPWLHSKELPNRLPICLNLALVQSPFFTLGIIFRHFENRVPHKLTASYTSLIFSIIIYLVFYVWLDHKYLDSSMCVVIDSYNNILLVFIFSIIGIWALMCLSIIVKTWRPFNYMGEYSILFYFLNGGALTIVSPIMKKISIMDPENYLNQIVVAAVATAFMFPCVWFINKYMLILAGNKDSFNKVSQKLGLKIKW